MAFRASPGWSEIRHPMLRLPGIRDVVLLQPVRCLLVGQVAEPLHPKRIAYLRLAEMLFLGYALHELDLAIGGGAAAPAAFGRGICGLGELVDQAPIPLDWPGGCRSGLRQWRCAVGLRNHPAEGIEETRVKLHGYHYQSRYRRLVIVVIHDFSRLIFQV